MTKNAALAFTIVALITGTCSLPYHGSSHVQINAQIGSRVDLSCSFAPQERSPISWRVDGELIAFGTTKMTRNPRIHLTGHGAITIQPVEYEDIKTYVCSTGDASKEQKFMLRQDGTGHKPPSPPAEYRDLGECRIDDRFQRKIDVITQHVERASERLQIIESQQSKFEYYLKSGWSYGKPPEIREYPTTTTTTYRPPYGPPPDERYDTPRASLKNIQGKRVHEYTWVIDRFDDHVNQAHYDGNHMLRTYFLTALPGYNMSVRLYPNKERYGYLAIYAEPAFGNYDHLMPWPFKMNYELAVVSHYAGVNDVVAGTIRPLEGKCPMEAFSRRHAVGGGTACGYSKFMENNEYRRNKYAYLKNGQFHVRIRLSDPQ